MNKITHLVARPAANIPTTFSVNLLRKKSVLDAKKIAGLMIQRLELGAPAQKLGAERIITPTQAVAAKPKFNVLVDAR